MEQDNRHIPRSSADAHNAHTRPSDTNDTDKLRENPNNDERIIRQKDENAKDQNPDVKSGSAFARKDAEGNNRVTNEQEQNEVVNPEVRTDVVNSLAKKDDEDDDDDDDDEKEAEPAKPSQPEIPAEPDYPTENPYEQIGDDPDVAQKKIPKF